MNELALFAGAGGGILGGHLLGWRTVCAVEINPYARQVLLARQADGCLPRFPVWDDITTFDGTPWRGHVDIVSGGFPCQDISAAGKGAGITGERSGLWSQMARIIGEVRPSYVWVENSPLLVDRGLAVVLGDLAQMGYDARWGVVGAHHAEAPHRRDRIWVLAYAQGDGSASGIRAQWQPWHLSGRSSHACESGGMANRSRGGLSDHQAADVAYSASIRGHTRKYWIMCDCCGDWWCQLHDAHVSDCGCPCLEWWASQGADPFFADIKAATHTSLMAYTYCPGCQEQHPATIADLQAQYSRAAAQAGAGSIRNWWSTEPHLGGVADGVASGLDIHGVHAGLDVGRVAEGIPDRAKRLHAIGNGQVPAALVLAWHLLTGE